ncbi:MAG: hypothetical protein FJY98_01785 [Candidatus Liptonbacteria bacterium]|nr:hypothetical protein [Candidatus Liptonbacteria bacterium]
MKTKYVFLLVLIPICISIAIFWVFPVKIQNPIPTSADIIKRYHYLMAHRLKDPLLPDRFPVHISMNPKGVDSNDIAGTWTASGTAFMGANGPELVVTSAHVFLRSGFYYVTIVLPENFSGRVWAIQSVSLPSPKNDAAVAMVGEARLIPQLWFGKTDVTGKADFARITESVIAQSQITGERYNVIGTSVDSTDPTAEKFLIMDYDPTPAESGSSFVCRDSTFIMSRLTFIDGEMQRRLGITPRSGGFALMTSVKIKLH